MRRAVAVALGLALALAGVELAVRVVAPQGVGRGGGLLRGPLTVPGDHHVPFQGRDLTLHVNRDGFVDDEWGPPAGPEIAVIGDSFVQAAQVAPGEGYGPRLEGALRAAGIAVDVRSMGVPGAGTATALGVLRAYALPRRPAMVILGFLVANDVLNNHPLLEGKDDKPFYSLRNGVLVPTDAEAAAAPGPLWAWSHGWRWATRAWAKRRAVDRKLALGGGLPIDLRVHDPACAEGAPRSASDVDRCAVWDDGWAVTGALIAEMARACGETPLHVVLFPDRAQVEGDPGWEGARGWDLTVAQARAARVAGAHAPVVDLLPALRARRHAAPLYLHADGHWTAAGHHAAAEATAAALLDDVRAVVSGAPQPPR